MVGWWVRWELSQFLILHIRRHHSDSDLSNPIKIKLLMSFAYIENGRPVMHNTRSTSMQIPSPLVLATFFIAIAHYISPVTCQYVNTTTVYTLGGGVNETLTVLVATGSTTTTTLSNPLPTFSMRTASSAGPMQTSIATKLEPICFRPIGLIWTMILCVGWAWQY
jgi:hypothetical protein